MKKPSEMRETFQPLADQAYQHIKNGIIRCFFKPGATLRIAELAEMLEMSQTPIREALGKLEREHLIRRYPQRRYVVNVLKAEDVENLFELRIAIETLAVRQASRRMASPARSELLAVMKEIEQAISAGNHAKLINFERQFHGKIMEASENPYLSEIGEGILDRIWIIQSHNLITSDRMLNAHKQHLAILSALEERNSNEAEKLMRAHLKDAKEYLVKRLSNRDDVLSSLIDLGPNSFLTDQGA